MLDDIVQLADNLWLVVGDLSADIPNSIVYRQRDRLYLMDSGVGATIRASIIPDMGSLNMDFFCTRNGKKFFVCCYLTATTVHLACARTSEATLPSRRRLNLVLPLVPITMRSM